MNRKALNYPLFILGLMIITYIIFFCYLSFVNHDHFLTNGFDLGIFDYAAWNNLHGNFFKAHFIGVDSLFAIHFQPILLPLSLVYLLWPDAKALLLVQTVVLALGALPLYWLAAEKLNVWAGLVFAAAYLLFPALQGANLFEFHPVTLAAGFLPFAYWYLMQRRFGLFLAFSILATACQEDAVLFVGMLGFYLFVTQKDWRGLAVGLSGFAIFLFLTIVFIPGYAGSETHFGLHRYQILGTTIPEVLLTVLLRPLFVWEYLWSNPDKVRYMTHLLAPVAYLSLLDPLTLFIAAPATAMNLLSDLPTTYALDKFHYSVMIVPFVVVSAINGAALLIKILRQKMALSPTFLIVVFMTMILLTTLSYQLKFGHTPLSLSFSWPTGQARYQSAQHMLQLISPDAVVSAQTSLSTHLTHRPGIYLFPRLSSSQYGPAEYIALDLQGNIFPIFQPEAYLQQVDALKTSKDYIILFEQDDYLLLRKQ